MNLDFDHRMMCLAMEEATKAEALGEVPIGAVIVNAHSGEIVATGHNRTILNCDPTAHAEIVAIRTACRRIGAQRIPDHNLYITLEPCAMCAGAISFARLKRIVFAADDSKGGGVLHGGRFFEQATCHHRPVIENGLMAEEASMLLKSFFQKRR